MYCILAAPLRTSKTQVRRKCIYQAVLVQDEQLYQAFNNYQAKHAHI